MTIIQLREAVSMTYLEKGRTLARYSFAAWRILTKCSMMLSVERIRSFHIHVKNIHVHVNTYIIIEKWSGSWKSSFLRKVTGGESEFWRHWKWENRWRSIDRLYTVIKKTPQKYSPSQGALWTSRNVTRGLQASVPVWWRAENSRVNQSHTKLSSATKDKR